MLVQRILRLLWWSFALLIVSLAVALSAARLLLPGMSEYRVQVESAARDYLQRPVQVGSLDAAWHGLSPVLKLEQVVIHDERFPNGELAISEVQIALDLIGSFTGRKWRTGGVKLIGIELSLETDLAKTDRTGRGPESLAWLLQQESIAVEDLQLHWSDPGLFQQPVQLTGLSLQLVNEGDRHQFLLETKLSSTIGETLKLAADIRGGSADFGDWRGRVYLKSERLALEAVQPLLPELPVNAAGELDLELWAGIRDQRLEWGIGSLVVRDMQLEATRPDSRTYGADLLSGNFRWQAGKSGIQLDLKEFALRRDGQTVWPDSDITFHVKAGDTLSVEGAATLLVLDEFHAAAALLPWNDAERLFLVDRLQPTGQLRDAEFRFDYLENQPPRFSMRARIENLQIASSAGLPGVSGLSGTIEGNLQQGYLRLDSTQSSLDVPKVFPAALALTRLNGVVHWRQYADSFRIESQQLSVESGKLGFVTRWQLDWPYQQSSPWLDMQLALDDLPLTEVRNFLPSGVMSPKAVAWLQRAFVSGTSTDTRLLLQGRLDQLPFDNGEGRLEAQFDFHDVELDYHPEWGQLDELEGSALFVGRSMQITGTTGRILESPVERVIATIDDLKKPLLEIDGTVGGTLAGMLEYVKTTPLAGRFGGLIEQVDYRGDARLQLGLDIPLKKGMGRLQVDGTVTLDGNDLLPKADEFALTDVHGEIHFTREGLACDKASAQLLGQPVEVSVYQQGPDGQTRAVVDIVGALKLVELVKQERPQLAPYIDGQAQWHALLQIPDQRRPGDSQIELQLRSDLVGVAIELPEPFTKQAAESRDLVIGWTPGQETSQAVWIAYAGLVDARVLLTKDLAGVRKAGVRFGGAPAQLPEDEVIHLSGRLAKLDPGRWISLFGSGEKGKATAPPLAVNLALDNFSLAGVEVKDIIAGSVATDPWYFHVSGIGAGGWVRWIPAESNRPTQVLANLEHLVLESRAVEPASEQNKIKPDSLPELDISIADLNWNRRELGSIKLVARRRQEGINFETVDMTSEAIVFSGHGYWVSREGQQSTSFSAVVNGGELADLAKLLGNPGAIKGGKLSGRVLFNWLGSPAEFSLATLEGDIDLKTEDGRLVSVSEGGAGKLLNLFSLHSLQRRLSLDFSDVFKEGFSFNKMEGHIIVIDGNAYTENFSIEGSSASIEISGRTGLVAQDYDQLVTVTPQVSSSLPIAGVIAGGPAVGAAVFLAEKLVGDQFNRITRVQYQVSGSWDKPVYKKLLREDGKNNESASAEDEP